VLIPVDLTEPIRTDRGVITKISLREPRHDDFTDLGMPTRWMQMSPRAGYTQETSRGVGAWIERLADIDPKLLPQLCLRDTLMLRSLVLALIRLALRVKETKSCH
jgi:hypothetical protein